ncbi:MAG TPA: 30S ribosomal protein S16 [Gammaproteobacteria bacterium]|nr:30S ribosomal protein S16 [Gammaproteobacteria bacterium]
MVVIRLSRGGAKKRPFYHVVVADKRRARDGRCIERVGYFNPIACGKDIRLHLNNERIQYWISQGAQPSDRVQQLLETFEKEAVNTDSVQ